MIADKAPDSQKGKRLQGFSCFVRLLSVLFLAVHAPVDFRVFVCQIEYVRQFLFDGGNAAGIPAFDHIRDFPGEL